jgi:hypothetical protein
MKINLAPQDSLKEGENPEDILCFYTNITPYIQIVELINTSRFKFERVLFPQERLMFTAVAAAELAVKTCYLGVPINRERIPCDRLQVQSSEFQPSELIAS